MDHSKGGGFGGPGLNAWAGSGDGSGSKKATLWDTLKTELEHESTHQDLEKIKDGVDRGKVVKTEDSRRAAEFLERMRRMEDRS